VVDGGRWVVGCGWYTSPTARTCNALQFTVPIAMARPQSKSPMAKLPRMANTGGGMDERMAPHGNWSSGKYSGVCCIIPWQLTNVRTSVSRPLKPRLQSQRRFRANTSSAPLHSTPPTKLSQTHSHLGPPNSTPLSSPRHAKCKHTHCSRANVLSTQSDVVSGPLPSPGYNSICICAIRRYLGHLQKGPRFSGQRRLVPGANCLVKANKLIKINWQGVPQSRHQTMSTKAAVPCTPSTPFPLFYRKKNHP